MKNSLLYLTILVLSCILAGCANGIVGKNTNANIQHLDNTLNSAVSSIRDSVVHTVTDSRSAVLDYLNANTGVTSKEICMGVLRGTIGWLDSAGNRDGLALVIDTLITHTGGSARRQLIAFRDSLLSPSFINHVQSLLRATMQEVILSPSEKLVNFALSDPVRRQLDSLLEMPIAAVLNDRAIVQIGKLREILLGNGLKKDLATLIDTSLLVLDHRLDSPLSRTINKIVSQNTDTVTKNAHAIMWSLIAACILIGAGVFFLQQYRVNQNKKMAYYLTTEIEKFRSVDEHKFHVLTNNIHQTMLDHQLEGRLNEMLVESGINKT